MTSRSDTTHTGTQRGFTLLELLVVVSIVALATAGVSLSLRDASATQLEREAQRLSALLDSARAQSRAMGVPLYWRPTPNGFELAGQTRDWLAPGTQATLATRDTNTPAQLVLGPEPLLPPQEMALTLQGRTLWLRSDGLRPFQVSPLPHGAMN
jgi:general secretion pathway protein H